MKLLVKEIKSKDKVVHFRRWRLLSLPWFSIFIHGIYKEDLDKDLHDHPWDIFTFIIWGGYYEESKTGTTLRKPFTWKYSKARKPHKIKELYKPVTYSLAIVGKRKRSWGYHMKNGWWMDHKAYRAQKNGKI